MADTPQTLALLSLGQELRGDIVSQINRRSAFLRLIPVVEGHGQNAAWAVEGDGHLAASFADGATVSDFGSDAQAQALLSWARVGGGFHVTGSAQRAAASAAAGPGGTKDLIGRNMKNSIAKVASAVNAQCFSGTGANQIQGLDDAISQTANTYATIDRSSVSYWRPTVSDPGALTAPTFAQIRSDRSAIFTASGELPDLGVCSPPVFDALAALFDNNRRFVQDVVTARGPVRLDNGFEALALEGMMIVKDINATANRLYYINTNYIELQCQMLNPPQLMGMAMVGQANDGYGQVPLGIRVDKLAKNGDADRYLTFTECQLVVRRPNAMGCRKNIAV